MPETKPAPCVTYNRVSTRDQRPELAREELRRVAALRGLQVVEEIEETGSGARNDRPGMARVLELARAGQVGHVLCWKLDRLGRSTIGVLETIDAIRAAGVVVLITSQGLELGPELSAMGGFALRILAAAAELERELISERTRMGLAGARRRGKVLGRPQRLTAFRASEALALSRAGVSYGEIGRRFDVSAAVVRRAVLGASP